MDGHVHLMQLGDKRCKLSSILNLTLISPTISVGGMCDWFSYFYMPLKLCN